MNRDALLREYRAAEKRRTDALVVAEAATVNKGWVVIELHNQGMTYRAIAKLLGLTPAGAQHLAKLARDNEWSVTEGDWQEPSRRPRLTDAELKILDRWVSGRMAAEIAAERGTTVRTVEQQIQGIYRKYGVSSRDELVRMMAE